MHGYKRRCQSHSTSRAPDRRTDDLYVRPVFHCRPGSCFVYASVWKMDAVLVSSRWSPSIVALGLVSRIDKEQTQSRLIITRSQVSISPTESFRIYDILYTGSPDLSSHLLAASLIAAAFLEADSRTIVSPSTKNMDRLSELHLTSFHSVVLSHGEISMVRDQDNHFFAKVLFTKEQVLMGKHSQSLAKPILRSIKRCGLS